MVRKVAFLFPALVIMALFSPLAIAQEGTFTLTILHTNDVHGAYAPYTAAEDDMTDGGAAREMTVINQVRAEGGNMLLVDAGDQFTGTLFHQQWRGQEADRFMNAMGYDVMTLGNHEFDDGQQVLADFITWANFPVISANIDFSGSPILNGLVKPSVILTVGGQQIGVIGLTATDTSQLSNPGVGVTFHSNLHDIVQPIIDGMIAEGINKIILLDHIGLEEDEELAVQLTGVDIIISGHSHTLLSNTDPAAEGPYPVVVTNKDHRPVYIVQTGSRLRHIGRLDVTFSASGSVIQAAGDSMTLSASIPRDPQIQSIVDELRRPISMLLSTQIGMSNLFLVGDRNVCRVKECNMGNLIADAMRAYAHSQIAMLSSSDIRSNIPINTSTPTDMALPQPQVITMGDVLSVLPLNRDVSTFELKGSDVIAALENGVSGVEDQGGRFLQVSGLRFTWDPSKRDGSRVSNVEILNSEGNYTPIEPDATYTVAASDYMRGGGDGYTMLEKNATNVYDGGSPIDVVVEDYIRANSPIAPTVEGRITRTDGAG